VVKTARHHKVHAVWPSGPPLPTHETSLPTTCPTSNRINFHYNIYKAQPTKALFNFVKAF